jgi:hypothetical protein
VSKGLEYDVASASIVCSFSVVIVEGKIAGDTLPIYLVNAKPIPMSKSNITTIMPAILYIRI